MEISRNLDLKLRFTLRRLEEKNMYTVDGYDKDNDVYAEYWRGKD